MAYDVSKLAKLKALKDLAVKVKEHDDALATRIGALEKTGSQANVIEGVKVNGSLLTLVDKIADILIAEGATNGTIKVNNVDVPVHGLAALAYKAEVSETELAAALKATIDAKAKKADLDTLTGEGEGSIKKMIDDAFNDFSTKVTDDGVVNSYKELIDWAATHGSKAAEMASGISTNKTAIENLKKFVGELPKGATATTVVDYIAEAVAALSIGNYMTTEAFNTAIAEYYKKTDVDTKLGKKVDKADGKSLIADTEITRLAGMSDGANKTEKSATNGNVKIDGKEVNVYTLPNDVVRGSIATDAEVTEMLNEVFAAAEA